MAKQTIEESGNAVTLIKYKAEGLTMETVAPFLDDPMSVFPVVNNRLTPVPLDDIDGLKTYHMKMELPMLISNRSIVTTLYHETLEDGTRRMIHSC